MDCHVVREVDLWLCQHELVRKSSTTPAPKLRRYTAEIKCFLASNSTEYIPKILKLGIARCFWHQILSIANYKTLQLHQIGMVGMGKVR